MFLSGNIIRVFLYTCVRINRKYVQKYIVVLLFLIDNTYLLRYERIFVGISLICCRRIIIIIFFIYLYNFSKSFYKIS